MEVSRAETRFCASFWYSVVIWCLVSKVECRNDTRSESSYNCPQRCTCDPDTQTVNCTNAGFKLVPQDIHPETRSLILDGNFFRHLRRISFRGLRRISNLSLRNCQINKVHAASFSSMSASLRMLWMSNNTLTKKKYRFVYALRKLELLDMSATGRRSYHDIYHMMSSLKYLFLANNFITSFPPTLPSASLLVLDVSQNLLKNFSFDARSKQKLNLKTLRLRDNAIEKLRNNSFLNFSILECVDLAENQISEVEPLAFRSKTLRSINLYNTNFRFNKENWNIFHQAPNLERINMSLCRIESGNSMRATFQDLPNLTDLDLSAAEINSLSNMFANLPNISRLQLSGNPISTLNSSDFEGIEDSLRELTVSSARLSTVTFKSLPLKVWKKLAFVDFSDNPFICDCNFIWLRRWLMRANASGVEVSGWDKYYCQTSKGQMNMLKLESPSDLECFQDPFFRDPCLVFLLLLTSLIWSAASTLSALHRFRWHLRYWYFMKTINSAKRSYQQRGGEERDIFSFDVFVGYSRSDSSWVINQLLPRLEREYNLRVCIHERDWLAGRDIAENILESIDESRKTLLIVSNAFALSPWCHFELTMAQTRLMEEDRDSLVLILLEEIADCNLTPRLGIQMQRRTYIEWTKQSNVGRQLFWANLKHALARPSNSLMIESLSTQLFEYKEKHIG